MQISSEKTCLIDENFIRRTEALEVGVLGVSPPAKLQKKRKKLWIDIDNSPHVPFFLPLIEEWKKQGVELLLTARNMYQVVELLKFYRLDCKVIGSHYGKNKILKVLCNCLRALQLIPTAIRFRPDLAISHGARAQQLVAKLLGICTVMMHDYEHSTKTGFLQPDWVVMPDVIPDGAMSRKNDRLIRYPGLKEDVYVPRFRPDARILHQLGISSDQLIVTLRPPATEAHYHNPESEELFDETVRMLASNPNVRMVTLARNGRQDQQLKKDWSQLIASGQMIIPSSPVDGLNLIWFSDLVVSGGGTMNREAAALGVPVYSIFRGRIGAVDHYLAQQGRLTLIESCAEVHSKIRLVRWHRPAQPEDRNRPVLQFLVSSILFLLSQESSQANTSTKAALAQPSIK